MRYIFLTVLLPTIVMAQSLRLDDVRVAPLIGSTTAVDGTLRITPSLGAPPERPQLHNDERFYNMLRATFTPIHTPALYALALSDDDGATWRFIDAHTGTRKDATRTTPVRDDFYDITTWHGGAITLHNLASATRYRARLFLWTPQHGTHAPSTMSTPTATDVPYVSVTLLTERSNFFILNTQRVVRAERIRVTVGTNSATGFNLYIRGRGDGIRGGLYNATSDALIPSETATLVPGTNGYGIQAHADTAEVLPPYNGTGTNVGAVPRKNTRIATYDRATGGTSVTITPHVTISGTAPPGTYTDHITYTATVGL